MNEADQTEQLTVRLTSNQSEANATAVASTMTAVVSLLSEAQQGLDANKEMLIKARPFAKGSFEIPLELIVLAAGTMFASNPLIENILDAIKKYFETKNLLKGSGIDQKDNATIVVQGNEINVGNVTLNLLDPDSAANREVARALTCIEKDETITGMELIRGQEAEPFVRVTRQQFGYYRVGTAPPQPETPERDVSTCETLTIASSVFQGDTKWRFNRAGHIVPVTVADQGFLKRVRQGVESFVAGDRLKVDLSVHQAFDQATSDYVNKSYTIERVLNHEKQQQQQNFLDNQE